MKKIEPRQLKVKKVFEKPVLSTELKNKHNKEIYEGDIVYFDFDSNYRTFIFWENGAFNFKGENQSTLQLTPDFAQHMITIGSLFENPELLNGGKND